MADASTDLVKAVRDIIREAWQTQARIPDVDARFVGFARQGIWNQSIRDLRESYGYSQASAKRSASSHEIAIMGEVMTWMVWLKGVFGQEAVNTLRALGMGISMQMLADRKHCDRSTIWRAEQDYVRAIIRQFRCDIGDVTEAEQVQEQAFDMKATIRYSRAPDSPKSGNNVYHAKVWIGGLGWFYKGKQWNDGGSKLRMLERMS